MIDLRLGDCVSVLRTLGTASVQTCVTSPPYFGLRDYGVDGQIGLEETPSAYVDKLVQVFREVRRVLADDGTLWLNLGDSYASNTKGTGGPTPKQKSNAGSFYETRKFNHGVKEKDLMGIPWQVAFALRADGWYLRSDIIWHKPNPMPESVRDRPTKAHEYIFLLSKSPQYFYDADAVREPVSGATIERSKYRWQRTQNGGGSRESMNGYDYKNQDFGDMHVNLGAGRNRRSVWTVTTKPYKGAHFATFPPDLIEPCILAGSRKGDTVLDPFNGSGTTGAVAIKHGRRYVGIELNPDYIELTNKRLGVVAMEFA